MASIFCPNMTDTFARFLHSLAHLGCILAFAAYMTYNIESMPLEWKLLSCIVFTMPLIILDEFLDDYFTAVY